MNELRHHTLAIFGATGGLGLELTRQALEAGHRVRALVRDPAKLAAQLQLDPEVVSRLTIEPGDATNVADARRVVRGSDAVLVALGAPALSKSRIRSEGTASVAQAMQAEGVERIVVCSVFGVFETRTQLPFFLKYVIFPFYLSRAVADHERQETVLQQSGLRWTAVRPPNLVDSDQTDLVHGVGEVDGMSMQISRHMLAHFMLEQVDRGDYLRGTPSVAFVDPKGAPEPAPAPARAR